ncbi:MAG: Cysteine desulfurase [Parcubacteria group bacterium GW2011_GWF2_38_8]|nr:MAG: Cysteine desulfurase [Parcubacteria group bacterium GW2011_GWF2_38_8]
MISYGIHALSIYTIFMPKSNLFRDIRTGKFKKIYLDYAASVEANPSSIHAVGLEAKKELENARVEVANVLGARSEEIIFTSGGTESNNLAIQGIVNAWELGSQKGAELPKLPHIITTNIEHPSVLETCKMFQKRKQAEISIVPVEENGIIDPKKIKKKIKANTVLVSVMYANNEIGTIQPIREIAREIKHYRKVSGKDSPSVAEGLSFPIFHTDAVQAANYLDINVQKLGVDLLSLSGSKIQKAGRVGILYKKKSTPLAAIFGGGHQEQGLRPGTENLPEILKFSKAFNSVQKNKEKESKRLTQLQNHFIKKIRKVSKVGLGTEIIINGDLENRLPSNINITFPKIPSDLLVIELSAKGVMVSPKSACKSLDSGGSYVIQAIHPELDPAVGGVRFSFGQGTTKADIDYTIKVLKQILLKLKKWYN